MSRRRQEAATTLVGTACVSEMLGFTWETSRVKPQRSKAGARDVKMPLTVPFFQRVWQSGI